MPGLDPSMKAWLRGTQPAGRSAGYWRATTGLGDKLVCTVHAAQGLLAAHESPTSAGGARQ